MQHFIFFYLLGEGITAKRTLTSECNKPFFSPNILSAEMVGCSDYKTKINWNVLSSIRVDYFKGEKRKKLNEILKEQQKQQKLSTSTSELNTIFAAFSEKSQKIAFIICIEATCPVKCEIAKKDDEHENRAKEMYDFHLLSELMKCVHTGNFPSDDFSFCQVAN